MAVRPNARNIIYSGAYGSVPGGGGVLLRFDRRTAQSRIITVWLEDQGGTPAKDAKYRFFFTFPILLSPTTPTFSTLDEGTTSETISPDPNCSDIRKMMEDIWRSYLPRQLGLGTTMG